MQQSVHFASIGILIFIKPTPLYVAVGDTVTFYADDDKEYEIVIPNKDKFFVSVDGATIEETATSAESPTTPAVNNKPPNTPKFYSVTVGGSGITNSPPRIIIGS